MKVAVQLFAAARQLAGTDAVTLEVPDRASVAELRVCLGRAFPPLAGLLERTRIAVNLEFAAENMPLPADAEIALIPPVSGG